MKNFIALFALALLFAGCTQELTNVFSPDSNSEVPNQCKASCVIADLQTWDEIIAPEDTAMIAGLIGDTLRTYLYRLEDGREGSVFKEEYELLKVGDNLGKCELEEAIGSCPNYGGN